MFRSQRMVATIQEQLKVAFNLQVEPLLVIFDNGTNLDIGRANLLVFVEMVDTSFARGTTAKVMVKS